MKWLWLSLFFISCSSSETKIPKPTVNFQVSSKVLDAALKKIDLENYDLKTMTVVDTSFHILGRKSGGLGLDRLEHSLLKMWPIFSKYFSEHPDEVAILDIEKPVGGGPLGDYIVGILFSKNLSDDYKSYVKKNLGWNEKKSTLGYVKKYYGSFKNPLQAYVDDMLVHAFGHIMFGWGLTTIDPQSDADVWFATGMGLVYDRLAWSEAYTKPSPFFSDLLQNYSTNFSKNPELDQKLVDPDLLHDEKHGLDRRNIFGKGKAFLYFSALRAKIGPENFDLITNSWLAKKEKDLEYESFVSSMSSENEAITEELEKEFGIK